MEVHFLSRLPLIRLPPHHQPSMEEIWASLQPSYPFCLHLDRRWARWINFTIHLVLKPLPSCLPFLSPSLSLPTSIKLWASSVSIFCNSFLTLLLPPPTHHTHSLHPSHLPSILSTKLPLWQCNCIMPLLKNLKLFPLTKNKTQLLHLK